MPDIAQSVISLNTYYIKEMFMIMPIVLIISVLIKTWVSKENIIKTFGDKSGLKGPIFSFILGRLSAGPIYAAFPVCTTLYKKGVKISNIVIILSSWSVIKIPMLINEYRFLGDSFMIARWTLTVLAILVLESIMEKSIIKSSLDIKGDMPLSVKKKLHISDNLCIDCSLSFKECPAYFAMQNGSTTIINKNLLQEDLKSMSKIINKCSIPAISAE